MRDATDNSIYLTEVNIDYTIIENTPTDNFALQSFQQRQE